MRPYELTLAEASEAVGKGELTAREMAESVLGRIAVVDPVLHPYVTVTGERALRSAAEADQEIAAGRYRGPLHGMTVALKDLIDVAGLPTEAGSRVRAGHVAAQDSTVAARLSQAGTVLLGKVQTHEFAFGVTTPQTANAWDHGRIAGGSSGGSAVAVATGAATFALGTDTGGSVRMPASLNGVVGFKPSYGLVSRSGVVPFGWSMDHVGPLTRTVRDAELVLPALTGYDPEDPASIRPVPRPRPAHPEDGLAGVRVGVPVNYYFERIDPEVEAAVRGALAQLAGLGAELVEVEIPMARYILPTGWGLLAPEAAAYHEETLRTVPELYGPEVRLLLEGSGSISAGDYLRAQRSRTLMRQAWARLFDEVDVIAAPTVPLTALPAGQESVRWPDGTVESVLDAYSRLTAPANVTGVPSLTLPVGRDHAGLPIGMQLMGRYLDDAGVLRVGHSYEAAHSPGRELAAVAA
ncbi:amidase [Streptomyces pinistramenti]|uniref:amidase n=1 Tax=Streptomyces pinistramenti TaxID=2884812 RepID=UPI001D061546|nr:amidase [Streptomyces pinistramenti]MCB5906510.1 Asp-tRNA(Asn)/Glu-tRNA(Gln) amidotransferase GatCAB subunit A [Streptomyces pinistramenti]